MTHTLVYQTSDPVFADRVVESLRNDGIECYRVGNGVRYLSAASGHSIADQVSILLVDTSDYNRANKILLELGATVDRPRKVPGSWVVLALAAILAGIISLLVLGGS